MGDRSVFTLVLLAARKVERLVSAEPAHEPGDRLRVLLVDDVADIRLLLRSLFAVYPGVEVVGEAGDGRQAIELAAIPSPTWSCSTSACR